MTKNHEIGIWGFGLACLAALVCEAAEPSPVLPRSTPEAQGVSSPALLDFINAADQTIASMHSFMLLRHGQVAAEGWWAPYAAERPHKLYSLSKSFTSTAVGLAVAEGRFSLDDTVLSFFPEDAPAEPSNNLKSMRVRDLLSMSTGHHAEDLGRFSFQSDDKLTLAFLALPVAHKPGTHFLYNTPATYMCSAIVQKTTGQAVVDYLGSRLFGPLGIQAPTWGASAQGISLGGYGLKVTTEDIARLGQLYLQKGRWQGKQLLPATWVDAATRRQTSNGSNPRSDWDQGYGYQFWRCRHGAYRGDGAFGQYCIVMPEQDAVVAITSGVGNMQSVLDLIWDKLLPAMNEGTLPANPSGASALAGRLGTLSLPTVSGQKSSPRARVVSGKKFEFPANDQGVEGLRMEFETDGALMTFVIQGAEHGVAAGYGDWHEGRTSLGKALHLRATDPGDDRVAASGAWTAEDTFTAKLWFNETPFSLTLQLRFSGDDQVVVGGEYNVAFGPRNLQSLTGKIK